MSYLSITFVYAYFFDNKKIFQILFNIPIQSISFQIFQNTHLQNKMIISKYSQQTIFSSKPLMNMNNLIKLNLCLQSSESQLISMYDIHILDNILYIKYFTDNALRFTICIHNVSIIQFFSYTFFPVLPGYSVRGKEFQRKLFQLIIIHNLWVLVKVWYCSIIDLDILIIILIQLDVE